MANGTIAFDTLQTSGQITGTAKSVDTDYVVNGSAKALCHVSANGATASNALNISSLDDDGTGDRGVNLTSAMENATYIVCLTSDDGASGAQTRQADTTNGTMTSSSFDFENYFVNSANNRTNVDSINYIATHGNLA